MFTRGFAGLVVIITMVIVASSCGGANIPTPSGPHVPPHVKLVVPPDGVTVAHKAVISVTLDLRAGRGISPDPEVSGVSLYLDGERIADVDWILEGQPPATGWIQVRTEPFTGYILGPGNHIFEVRYKDLAGQQFSYSWQVTGWDVPGD